MLTFNEAETIGDAVLTEKETALAMDDTAISNSRNLYTFSIVTDSL